MDEKKKLKDKRVGTNKCKRKYVTLIDYLL